MTKGKLLLLMLSLYDISDTDPADILGNDVIAQPQYTYDEEVSRKISNIHDNLDFNEEVARKISNIRRRSVQISGDSF